VSRWREPPATREDIAAGKLVRACAGRGHAFPRLERLQPTETEPDPDGGRVCLQRTNCPDCGALRVRRWREPPGSTVPGTRFAVAVVAAYEPPEPGDVPGIANLAAQVTDDEVAAAIAESGYHDAPPPPGPGKGAAMRAEILEVDLQVRAWQFYLLDADETPASIVPIPADAADAGIIDSVPGATLLWTGLHEGTVGLTVVLGPADPGADLGGYQDVVEISHRSTSGRLAVTGLTGTAHPLPALPGYGDYRLRYHVQDADAAHRTGTGGQYLLQIWPAPRTRPAVLQATSAWASQRALIRTPPPPPAIRPWRPERSERPPLVL
jgi:hypothetical protein